MKLKKQRRQRRKKRRLLRAEHEHKSVMLAMDPESEITLVAADGEPKEGELRKFKMVAYKGGRLFVESFYHPVVVDLTGLKTKRKNYPSLLQHDPNKRVGHTTQVTVEATKIAVDGLFSGANDHASEVLAQSENGFPWQASIGVRMERDKVEFYEEGKSVEVNGRKFKGPIHVVRASVLNEISFVPVGADEDGATARVAAAANNSNQGDEKMKFEQWLKAKGFDINVISAEQKEFFLQQFDKFKKWLVASSFDIADISEDQCLSLTAMFDASQASSVCPGEQNGNLIASGDENSIADELAQQRQMQAAESNRVRRVREICAEFNDPNFRINNQTIPLEAHAIEQGWDANRTELECRRESRGTASVHTDGHTGSCTIEAMQGAAILSGGVALDNQMFGTMQAQAMGLPGWTARDINDDQRQRIMEAAHRFSEMHSLDICREAVRLDGRMVPSGRSELIQAAFSGSNLQNIWTTNVNARLLSRFRETEDTTQGWTQERDVADFRLNERARVEKGGRLSKHSRGGSADHHSGDDTKEEYRIARYSKQFFRDEMDVIDDRLMAGQQVIDEMALAAARLRPDLVYAILMGNPNMKDGTPLFDASRNNLDDVSAAMDESHLKEAITRMWLQQENGVNLNLTPTHLVTAATLSFSARQLLRSAETRAASATGGPTMNAVQNAVANLVSDSRIDNGVVDPDSGTTIAGDATAFFVLSNQAPTIEVGYLRGTGRAPSVTTWRKTGEDGQWGIGASVKMDIGAAAMAFQGMQKLSD